MEGVYIDSLIEGIPAGICIRGAEGEELIRNSTFSNYIPDTSLGESNFPLLPDLETRIERMTNRAMLTRKERILRKEAIFVPPEGRVALTDWYFTPCGDKESPNLLLICVLDITTNVSKNVLYAAYLRSYALMGNTEIPPWKPFLRHMGWEKLLPPERRTRSEVEKLLADLEEERIRAIMPKNVSPEMEKQVEEEIKASGITLALLTKRLLKMEPR